MLTILKLSEKHFGGGVTWKQTCKDVWEHFYNLGRVIIWKSPGTQTVSAFKWHIYSIQRQKKTKKKAKK